MIQCKTVISPMQTHWGKGNLAISVWYGKYMTYGGAYGGKCIIILMPLMTLLSSICFEQPAIYGIHHRLVMEIAYQPQCHQLSTLACLIRATIWVITMHNDPQIHTLQWWSPWLHVLVPPVNFLTAKRKRSNFDEIFINGRKFSKW